MDRLLNVEQASEALGIKRSKLYELLSKGELGPVIKIGRRTTIPTSSVEDWIRARKVAAGR